MLGLQAGTITTGYAVLQENLGPCAYQGSATPPSHISSPDTVFISVRSNQREPMESL